MCVRKYVMAKDGATPPPAPHPPTASPEKWSSSRDHSVHFLVYVLCIASLGAAVYSNVRLRTHEDRIRTIEVLLRDSGLRFRPTEDVSVTAARLYPNDNFNTVHNVRSSAEEDRVRVNYRNLKKNVGDEEEDNEDEEEGNYDPEDGQEQRMPSASQRATNAEVLERLQHQMAGIQQRLRRDVSQVQPLIRAQRQTSDCLCPAGECGSE